MDAANFDFTQQPGLEQHRDLCSEPIEPLVSIITPYYNAGKYFEQTFWSVINQTFPWFEWIVVDDGSTNQEDVEILHRFASMDIRIHVVTKTNGGISSARNAAIRISSTSIVIPLDGDDLIAPTFVEVLYWALKKNPDCSWAYSNSVGFNAQEYLWDKPFDAKLLKTYNFLVATAAIRKADLEEVGLYDDSVKHFYEDWHLWLRFLSKGKKPVKVRMYGLWYRRFDTGVLGKVESDPKIHKVAVQMIENAAAEVDTTVTAATYPAAQSKFSFHTPVYIPWKEKVFDVHDKRRVLWLIPWMTMGGADQFNLDAIGGLKRKGFQNFILTTQPSENEWQQKFERFTDEIFNLPDFLDPVYFLEFVSYFIQSRDIDVLMVSNSYDGYYMIPWIRQHFPDLVITDYVHMEEWYWRAGGYARTSGAQQGLVDKTWVCNSATRNVLVEHFGRKKEDVDCMYIGVDQHHFDPNTESPGYLHKKLGIAENRPIILFPCRVHPQKRPFLMTQIAQRVVKEVPEAAFVVVGDGPQLKELESDIRAKKLEGSVFCIGRSTEMRACYRDSTLTLICSLKEGLALTAYESLAMGVPVVSSDVGGQRDLIDDSVGGLIPMTQSEEADLDCRKFPEQEIQPYADRIVEILHNPHLRIQMSKAGREKIEAGFTIEKMVSQLSSELTALCEDEELLRRHRQLSEALQLMPGFAADYYTMYQQWKIQDSISESIWAARCYFEEKFKAACTKYGFTATVKKILHKCRHKAGELMQKGFRKIKSYFGR